MPVIALDIGGTKIAAALVGEDGEILARSRADTPARAGGHAIADACAGLVGELAADDVRGVGIGTAGVVSRDGRSILASTDAIAGWAGIQLADAVEDATGQRVIAENDVSAHARGELWRGAAAGADSLLMMAIGTGIGGAIVAGGKILFGEHGVAGDMGHLPAGFATNLPCPCGRPAAHLEAIASGPGLLAWYHERGGDREVASTREMMRRAQAGEDLAAAVYADGGRAVGRALGGLANILDPAVVLVGGGMADSGPLWWRALRAEFAAQLVDPLAGLKVRQAALGSDAALVGAARLALTTFDPKDTP